MEYSVYMMIWFFILYSLTGWIIGTSFAAVRTKKFVDVGFLYGPYCPAYGITGVMFTLFLTELRENLFFLFLGGSIIAFLITMGTGFLLERIFHRKWWDYSRKRFQFGGYVNLPYTVLWGLLAVFSICFINPMFEKIIFLLPLWGGKIVLWAICIVMLLDLVGTGSGILKVHSHMRKMNLVYEVSENMQKTADALGEGLAGWVLKHFGQAYPQVDAKAILKAKIEREKRLEEEKEKAGIFAVGCSFYKIICIFFLAAFLGDITETIFCLITAGKLMSRSSVVYGPFSIVWGLGCVGLTAILYQYRNHSDRYIFCFGTILGGAYEYACSVFSEMVFGTVFWDYSKIPFNLGGRINLLYCFFWGIAAVVWMKILYPFFSDLIEKIPKKPGQIATWIMIVLMSINMLISALSLNRYVERNTGKEEAETNIEQVLDQHFPDERMKRVYPNMKVRK